jgi:hypothetical protein
MDRPPPVRAATRTVAQLHDADDYRTVILDALTAAPVDEQALRDAVWTYVRTEREVGVAPGLVILALTEMVESARLVPLETSLARTRQVILWCVEAYFGHLGGDALGRDREPSPHTSSHDSTRPASS